MKEIIIPVPKEFSFELSLQFLLRSPKELLHTVEENTVIKFLEINGTPVLFKVAEHKQGLALRFLNGNANETIISKVVDFVTEWFDLQTDLKPFYKMGRQDALLKSLIEKYYGYRIIGQPDLFESLVWAVMGQQINVAFAYTLKQRFVQKFGKAIEHQGKTYYQFPSAQVTASLSDDDLLPLQFSRQKSKYVVLIAKAFAEGVVSKEKLAALSLLQAKEELMKIKGVGNWTANYALMKTFRHPDAFPLEDVAIHNAIRILKNMKTKPSLEQVKRVFKKYKGWEAYATLYLWKSL